MRRRRRRAIGGTVAVAAAGVLLLAGSAAAVLGDFAQPATSPEAVSTSPIGIAAGNLNGDAHTDLAVTSNANDVTILLGSGGGNFAPPMTSPETVGTGPTSVAIANLDGDGDQDLAVANNTGGGPGTGVVSILLNNGAGDFTAATDEIADNAPVGVTAANLNGDALPDLAVTNNQSHDVSIFINDGMGPDLFTGPTDFAASINPRNIVAANIDGDGDIDLAIPNNHNAAGGDVSILLGDGTGSFTPAAGSPEDVGTGPDSAAGADLNGDTKLDLAVVNGADDNVSILLGDGMGDFTEKAMTSPESVGDLPLGVVAANLNGDAFPDLAVTNFNNDNVSILINDGTGNFGPAGTSPEGAGDQARDLVAADLNGDAALDLAVTNNNATPPGTVSILLNQLPPVVPTPSAATPALPATTAAAPTPKCKKKKSRVAAVKKKRCKKRKKR